MAFLYSLCLLFPQFYNLSSTQRSAICKYEHEIRTSAKRNDIEPELLAAVIFVESGFHRNAESHAGACGLTQVIPKWTGGKETRRKKYTCKQLKKPVTSIRVGAEILGYTKRVYAKGDISKALCYYNAGTKCITKKGYYKRSGYVKKVMRVYDNLTDGC